MGKSKKITKDNNTSHNRFLLMLDLKETNFLFKNETSKKYVYGKSESSLILYVPNKLYAANNFKNNERKQLF